MRKYLYAAPLAAAAALVLATPAALAHTATPRTATHVLTIGKLHGRAVKAGAVLKASLAKGTSVTISIAGSTTEKMTCKKASFTLKVHTNPVARGKATGTATSEKLSSCKINISGVTVTSVTAMNLPYNVSIRDSKGDPVTVAATGSTAPIEFTASVSTPIGPITCSYDAAVSTGHASNRHHTVTFKSQKFSEDPGDGPFCQAGPASLNVTFGPIRDASVRTSPIVFVN